VKHSIRQIVSHFTIENKSLERIVYSRRKDDKTASGAVPAMEEG
jgi:hypothetical protein